MYLHNAKLIKCVTNNREHFNYYSMFVNNQLFKQISEYWFKSQYFENKVKKYYVKSSNICNFNKKDFYDKHILYYEMKCCNNLI